MKSLCSANFYNYINNWVMQNASHDKWRESSAISDGNIRSISFYKITCSKHQTCPYGCDMVDSQSVRRLLIQEIQEAKKLLKLLADHLQQNVQIQSGEKFPRDYKIVVSNDQCYVSIKPKEEGDGILEYG
jgi:hypothetical protein